MVLWLYSSLKKTQPKQKPQQQQKKQLYELKAAFQDNKSDIPAVKVCWLYLLQQSLSTSIKICELSWNRYKAVTSTFTVNKNQVNCFALAQRSIKSLQYNQEQHWNLSVLFPAGNLQGCSSFYINFCTVDIKPLNSNLWNWAHLKVDLYNIL